MVLKKLMAGLARLIPGAGGRGGRVNSGSATGKVYVGDLSFEIQHAYAYAPPRDEELWVYLTDTPLTDKQVTKRFGVHDAARAGQVHGVKLSLDPADSVPKSLSAVLLMPPERKNSDTETGPFVRISAGMARIPADFLPRRALRWGRGQEGLVRSVAQKLPWVISARKLNP